MKMIQPVWGRVLVQPDEIHETDPTLKKAKDAGIYIPEDDLKKEQVKQIEGTLVAIGGSAFEKWQGDIPKVGDRIIYDLYAGMNVTLDDKRYQIIHDTDVIAIIGQ